MNLKVDRLLDRCFMVLMALVFGVMKGLIFKSLRLHRSRELVYPAFWCFPNLVCPDTGLSTEHREALP
jgi:hypothetical protein